MTSVAPVSLAVQVCSFVSSIALARVLGATGATDAYYLGLSMPVLVYGILLGALRSGAIPALTEAAGREGEEGLKRSASDLLSGVLAASVCLALLVTACFELALPLIVGGHALDLTRVIVLELAPYAVLGAMTGVFSAVLAVRGLFVVPVAVMVLEPVFKSALIFGLGHQIGVQALVAGNLAGGGVAAAVLWYVLRKQGLSLRLARRFDTSFVRDTARVSIPLIVSMSVLQVNPVIDRTMASSSGAGSVTALELGLRLFLVPAGIVTGLLIAPITATWALRKAEGGWIALQGSITRALVGAAAVVPPFVVLGVMLRHQLVALFFQGGAYSADALQQTTSVFALILLALPAQMLVVVFSTLFLVQKDTVFPMKIAFANVVLNIALNFVFREYFGVAGIALSTSLTFTLLLLVYMFAAHRRWGPFFVADLKLALMRVAASAGGIACVAALLLSVLPAAHSRPDVLLVVFAVGAAALVTHAIVLLVGRDPLALGVASHLRHLAPR